MASIRKQYTLTNDPVGISWGNDVTMYLRFESFERMGSNGKPVKPFEKHAEDFYKKFNATGGRRKVDPTEQQRDDMLKEGLIEILFDHVEGEDDAGSTVAENKAWFRGMLFPPKEGQPGYDPKYNSDVFFADVLLAVRDRKTFEVEHSPGQEPDAAGK
jgi:hypothetical protein